MISNRSVEAFSRSVGYELKVEPRQLVDGTGYYESQSLVASIDGRAIPSLGSATASEDFFSSLSESSRVVRRGVTFASTSAAVCSRAEKISFE